MKIGELSQRTGTTTKTIRYYEEIQLLPPPARELNGYRSYDEEAVDRLLFIRDAQATGLTLTEIASILELRGKGESTCSHVIELIERHLRDLDEHIKSLRKTRKKLAAMAERAHGLDPSTCTDPHRCQTIEHDVNDRDTQTGRHVHVRPAKHRHGASNA